MPGRNDPCPCGSGQKYKKCCGKADLAAEIGAHVARADEPWEVEAVPVQVGIDSEPDARPVAVLVSADGNVLESELRARLGGEVEDVASALERAIGSAARKTGSWPSVVRVRQQEVADALAPSLAPRDVAVETAAELPDLEAAARALMEHFAGAATWPPVCSPRSWSGWGLTHDLSRNIMEAAAAFRSASPWEIMENEQAPRVRMPSGSEWMVSVLGAGGELFGIVLYSDPRDLERTLSAEPGSGLVGAVGRVLSFTFDDAGELPARYVREVQRAGWTRKEIVPVLVTVNSIGGGLSRSDAADLATLLRALPAFAAANDEDLGHELATDEPIVFAWRHEASGAEFRYTGAAGTEPHSPLDDPDLAREVRRAVAEAASSLGPGADESAFEAAVNERLSRVMDEQNRKPQAALGGLSPVQVQALLQAEWDDAGTVVLRRDLSSGDVARSDAVATVRALLARAAGEGGVPLTEKGNIKVKVVRELLDELAARERFRVYARTEGRLIEDDVWPLHMAHVTVKTAGLARKRKGRLEATTRGRALLDDDAAGELFALVFRTRFDELNIAYGGWGPEWPGLQDQLAFTLNRFGAFAGEWHSAEWLAERIVLPAALEELPPYFDTPEWLVDARVLWPLVEFGLAEARDLPGREPGRSRQEYRKTRLFDRFLEFRI